MHMGRERLVEEVAFQLIEECHKGARVCEVLLGKRVASCVHSGMETS